MKSAIIIMAKAPVAGTVKTRLEPFLSPEQCAALAECFLRDTIEKTKKLRVQLIIAHTPPEQRSRFDRFEDQKTILHEQRGNDLGERIYSAFQFAFKQNFQAVVMIGTDSPTFPLKFIEQAFEFLEINADAVLGKTIDGGFYLIGLRGRGRALRKEIFECVQWSSPETFSRTKENILRLKLSLKELPDWYDVDEPEDLKRLEKEFNQDESIQKISPQTFKWLAQNLGAGPPAAAAAADTEK